MKRIPSIIICLLILSLPAFSLRVRSDSFNNGSINSIWSHTAGISESTYLDIPPGSSGQYIRTQVGGGRTEIIVNEDTHWDYGFAGATIWFTNGVFVSEGDLAINDDDCRAFYVNGSLQNNNGGKKYWFRILFTPPRTVNTYYSNDSGATWILDHTYTATSDIIAQYAGVISERNSGAFYGAAVHYARIVSSGGLIMDL